MIGVESAADQAIVERWIHAGQGHVFRFWDRFGPEEREGLLTQLRRIPLDLVEDLAEKHLQDEVPAGPGRAIEVCQPPPYIPVPTTPGEKAKSALRRKLGEETLAAGRVAVLVVAGGQGTRLGFDGPKGTLPIAPITGKSLFALVAEKVRALGRRHGVVPGLYVMTSPTNHDATIRYFHDANDFRLDPDRLMFFSQKTLPAVDGQGKVLLESPARIFESPDGHGGAVDALAEAGGLERMRRQGVEQVFYCQVDNPLVRIADPLFLGYHIHREAQVSTKVVLKRDVQEKVGILALSGDALQVLEYSDLPAGMANETDEDGHLRFRLGNTAIHVFARSFLERVSSGEFHLPYHMARKKIPTIDEEGNPTVPAEPNGVKFERFVFDLLPYAAKTVLLEARREEEFSPVKNAEGDDSPASARRDLVNLFGRWLGRAGIETPRDEGGNVKGLLEVGPLYALDEEELLLKVDRNLRFEGRLLLDED